MASKDQIADEHDLFPVFPASVSLDQCCNDQLNWVFQTRFAPDYSVPCPSHAVTLVETLCWGSQRQKKRRPGQAKQTQELEIV
jgi:hypothetical protein